MSSNRLFSYTVLAALAVLLSSCGTRQAPQSAPGGSATPGRERAANRVEVSRVEIPYFSADGKKRWVISADRATGETNAGATDVEGVKCELFEGDVRIAGLRAGKTHIDYEKRYLVLAGDVAVEFAQQGIEVECKRFRWNWDGGAFIADGGIEFRKGGASGRGNRLEGNTSGTTFVLF